MAMCGVLVGYTYFISPFHLFSNVLTFLFLINTFVWKSIEYDVFSPFIAVYMCTKYLNITMEVLFKTSFMLFSFATSISAPSCALPGLYQPLDASLQDSEGISRIFFMNLQDWQSGRLTGMNSLLMFFVVVTNLTIK